MTPSRVPEAVAGRRHTGMLAASWCRVLLNSAACALTLALGATVAHAQLFLPLGSFGGTGSGAGQFLDPLGVATDDLGSPGGVYVADSGNARVQKFTATGGFIAAWGWGVSDGMAQSEVCTSNCQAGIAGSGPGQFSRPTSIGVDNSGGPSSGSVYVGDAGNNTILKFDGNGNFLSAIDGSNTNSGAFTALVAVAVDQIGHVWAADDGTDNVYEFDDQGNFVQQWNDTYGTTVTMAVDRSNNAVYLIRGTTATERWTLTGGDETQIDANGGTALAVDQQSGTLYVDHGSDVAVYDAAGTSINTIALITSNSQGLGFGSAAGVLYVSDVTADNVTIYGPPTTPGPPLTSTPP